MVWGHQIKLPVTFGVTAVLATLPRLTPCYCYFLNRNVMCVLRKTLYVNIRLLRRNVLFVCTLSVLASKKPRYLANWTHMGHDKAGTYSFYRVCDKNWRIATAGASCLGQHGRLAR